VLVDTTAGPADRRSVAFPGGAGLLDDDSRLWVLGDSLGGALAVARREGARSVDLIVDDAGGAGVLARRASQFADAPSVWRVAGAALERVEPEPLAAPPPLPAGVAAFADLLTAAGADPVVEHGRLIGEVLGLEVARVVVDGGEPHLEVGVGRFDREANALLTGDQPDEVRLRAVVETVREHRRTDAENHPLQLLAAARWLRSRLVADPGLVGADHLVPLAPTVEPPDLRTPWPAPATGIDLDGQPVVVVASVGVDLDLVPAAADARLADGRAARLVLALPARDVHPVTVALAAALTQPAEIVTVELR
jgi:hypothetical protein